MAGFEERCCGGGHDRSFLIVLVMRRLSQSATTSLVWAPGSTRWLGVQPGPAGCAARPGQVAAKSRPSRPVSWRGGRNHRTSARPRRRCWCGGLSRTASGTSRRCWARFPLTPRRWLTCAAASRVLVLSDLTLPPSAPPVAAAAFRLRPARWDRAAGRHRRPVGPAPAGPGPPAAHRRADLLRAEGFERVQPARARRGGGVAAGLGRIRRRW